MLILNNEKYWKNKYYESIKVKSTGGKELNGYWDFIKLFENSNLQDIIFLYSENIDVFYKTNVIGIELFGLLFNQLFRYTTYLNPLFFLKKRNHGNRKRLYGKFNNSYSVVLLDDVITTGKTINNAIMDLGYLLKNFDLVDLILCVKNNSNLKSIKNIEIVELLKIE